MKNAYDSFKHPFPSVMDIFEWKKIWNFTYL